MKVFRHIGFIITLLGLFVNNVESMDEAENDPTLSAPSSLVEYDIEADFPYLRSNEGPLFQADWALNALRRMGDIQDQKSAVKALNSLYTLKDFIMFFTKLFMLLHK